MFCRDNGRRRGDKRAAGGVPDEAAVLQPLAFGVRERERGDAFRQRVGDDRADADALACRGVVEEVPVLHERLGDANEGGSVIVVKTNCVRLYGKACASRNCGFNKRVVTSEDGFTVGYPCCDF